MIHNTASLISRVLHPLLMPAYLFISLGYFYPSTLNNPGKNTFVLVSFMFTIITALPLINLMLLRSMGILEKFSQNKQLERILPIIAVTIIYFVTLLATAGCHGIQDSCILHNDTQHNGVNLRAPSNAMVIVVF